MTKKEDTNTIKINHGKDDEEFVPIDTLVSADPMRSEYYNEAIIATYIDGAYAVKEKVDQFLDLRNAAHNVCSSGFMGREVINTNLLHPEARFTRNAHVSILMKKGSFNSVRNSVIGYEMMKDLFMHGDEISFSMQDLNTIEARFTIRDVWATKEEAEKMDSENLIPLGNLKDYLEKAEEAKKMSFSEFKKKEQARTARDENIGFNNYIFTNFENIISNDAKIVPKEKRKNVLELVKSDVNVTRDALLALHYLHGIGVGVKIGNITDENSNRVLVYKETLCVGAASVFNTPERLKLLRLCVARSFGMDILFSRQTCGIDIQFKVENKYIQDKR